MFVTITRIDAKGNERENLVNVDEIVTVLEVRQEPQTLYDEDGNEVEDAKLVQQKLRIYSSLKLHVGDIIRR